MSIIMSYRLSYPLYLDVSDHNKQNHFNRFNGYQREENTSPTTALINLNAFYENMIANGQNSAILNPVRTQVPSLGISNNAYYGPQRNPTKKLSTDNNSMKSSFSIEAILGINRQNNNYLMANANNEYDFNPIRYRSEYSFNEMSVKAKSIASVSPDSTAKEQNLLRYNQRPKAKTSSNLISLQTNNNKRNIDCVDSSELKQNKNLAKIELNQRLVHNSMSQTKSKRVRTIFTPEQLEKLEAEFERQQYMVGPERLYLASALNLSEAQVKVWFQNRRIKWRKQHLELEHARFKNHCHGSNQVTTDNDVEDEEEEEEESSSISEFKNFQTVENDAEFLCQSPNSVDILH